MGRAAQSALGPVGRRVAHSNRAVHQGSYGLQHFVPSATSAYLRTNKPIRAAVYRPSESLSKARQEQVLKIMREWLPREDQSHLLHRGRSGPPFLRPQSLPSPRRPSRRSRRATGAMRMKVSKRGPHWGDNWRGNLANRREPMRRETARQRLPWLDCPGCERASSGLESRLRGNPYAGSNPTSPAPTRGHPDRPTTNQTPCTASSPRFQSR